MDQRKKITIRVTPEDLKTLRARGAATGLSLNPTRARGRIRGGRCLRDRW